MFIGVPKVQHRSLKCCTVCVFSNIGIYMYVHVFRGRNCSIFKLYEFFNERTNFYVPKIVECFFMNV